MFGGNRDQQTICAISTPHGLGGISVLRISGPQAFQCLKKIAKFLPEKPESHRAYYGNLRYLNQEILDEVVITYFSAGRSFTGEEVFEISCHGSPFICQEILSELVLCGCSIAGKGEFTYRAFMNGRIDLVQAESVLSMIESQSKSASQLALRQLEGHLSNELRDAEDKLIWLLANFEASIDFSAEDIDVLDYSLIDSKLGEIQLRLGRLVDSYKLGKVIKDGVKIALVGRPNVGKSSLLNLLLQEDRAIVTDIPGTTRDVLSGDTIYEGLRYTFLDTAGIRFEGTDKVELIGIERSFSSIEDADLVLLVLDSGSALSEVELDLVQKAQGKPLIVLVNKVDLPGAAKDISGVVDPEALKFLQNLKLRPLFVSAFDKNARSVILKTSAGALEGVADRSSALLSQARHYENLSRALENCKVASRMIQQKDGAEFLALELKEALLSIQETLGKRFDDQIMDRVFKEFCIGK